MQGDEISQAVQVEIEGIKMFFKGSLQVVSWTAQAFNALFKMTKDKFDHIGGECSLKHIFKLSEPESPLTIFVDKKDEQEFFKIAEDKGLQYCKLIDFDLTDEKIPIAIPPKQMSVYATLVDAFSKRKLSKEETALRILQNDIDEIKEKINFSSKENKDDVTIFEKLLENKLQSRDELQKLHDMSLKTYERKNYVQPLGNYLASAKGTEFERDPDKAVSEYNQGVPMARSQTAKECMQPIRNPFLIPTTKTQCYVPEKGVTIERTYHSENDVVYSNYYLKTEQGAVHFFSDKNMSKEKWNTEILPKMLDVAGIVEGIKCKIFETMEQVKAYFKHFGKTTPLSETNQKVFPNAEIITEAELAIEDTLKGMASAKANINIINFKVPQEKVFAQNGKLIYAPDGLDGALYMFGKIEPGEVKDGMISFSALKNDLITVKEKYTAEKNISVDALKNIIHENRAKAVDIIRKAATQGK